MRPFVIDKIRVDFPVLRRLVAGRPLVYFDNAATTLKPESVISAEIGYYREYTANIHRGVHTLSEEATARYEAARQTVCDFIHARSMNEIVFTRGATESINLVAHGLAQSVLGPGDEILISEMEHHSNIVPWQLAAERAGAAVRVIPMNDAGELDMEAARRMMTARTKVVGLVYVSNSLGTVNPVKAVIDLAHRQGALVLIDAAQAVNHRPVDVQDLDCDFLVFSGHKVFGPTGTGVLYGKAAVLERLPPYQGGGDMIASVTFERTEYAVVPHRFEAGTPNIAGVIGLAEALQYAGSIGFDAITAHEQGLLARATERLCAEVPDARVIGTAPEKAAILSFVIPGIHPHDLGTLVDQDGVALRTGHHCTQPVMAHFNIPATSRASFAFYNTIDEIEVFVRSVKRAVQLFL